MPAFNLKKIISILILSASIIGVYLITKNSGVVGIAPIKKVTSVKEINEQLINNKPLVEDIIQKKEVSGLLNYPYSQDSQGNLSENLTQGIFEQIKQTQSADILNNKKGGAPSVDDIFKNAQINFNLVSDIDDAELKISQNNSREEKIKYLEAVKGINKRNFGDFNKSYLEVLIDVFQKLEFSSATRLATIYKNLASDYLNLTVPSSWIGFHKKAIIFYKNSEIVYQALANYPKDPIKAYLALEMVEGLVSDAEQTQEAFSKETQQLLKI